MWPKTTNVLEEFFYHWHRELGVGGWGGGVGGVVGGGGNGMFVPPTFNPTFLFSS